MNLQELKDKEEIKDLFCKIVNIDRKKLERTVKQYDNDLLFVLNNPELIERISTQQLYTATNLLKIESLKKGVDAIENFKVNNPKSVFEFLKTKMNSQNEVFITLLLDNSFQVKRTILVSKGDASQVAISPHTIVRSAIINNASKIIIAHNHPTGDPHPSMEDMNTTDRIQKILEQSEIELIDHIILGRNKFYSFKEGKELISPEPVQEKDKDTER